MKMTLNMEQHLITDDVQMSVHGYRRSRCRTVLVHIASALCCGLPYLVFHWVPVWFLYATSVRCAFHLADSVLVVETYQKKCKTFYIHRILEKDIADTSGIENDAFEDEELQEEKPKSEEPLDTPIHLDDGTKLYLQSFRYFMHKKAMVLWDGGRCRWARVAGLEAGALCAQLRDRGDRMPTTDVRNRMLNIYGVNEINVPVQSILTLILLEVFNPFYVFQVFTIAVWLAEPYYYYCIAVVLMSTFGVATSVIQTKKNQESLRRAVHSSQSVLVLVDGRAVRVSGRAVRAGDVVLLRAPAALPADAVLLQGGAVVNESMLTGESVPVTKTPLSRAPTPYDPKQHGAHTLYCGTQLIQIKPQGGDYIRALVIRTGYNTTKGQLVRSILYPVPADFKFDRDSYKFIIILAGIALIGLAYTVALKAYRALGPRDIILKAIDIITIVVPPALPAAMTVGRLYAVSRLKRAGVACLNTRAVNVSGSIDCVCFDKTGTLTEEGLDMWGVVPVVPMASSPVLGKPVKQAASLNDLDDLKMGMATCHSLSIIDGQLSGDPLDLKMFESTGWVLEEPRVPLPDGQLATHTVLKPRRNTNINVDDFHLPLEVTQVHQNQFVSSLSRASAAVRVRGEDVRRLYLKGAPEVVARLCGDTVPANLPSVLSSYAEQGYRVIALATAVLEVTDDELQLMTRDEMEKDLRFLGLVIMENKLKPGASDVIRELKDADINVVMITGDNIHTAVSVAKECGIVCPGERLVLLSTHQRDEDALKTDSDGIEAPPVIYCQSTLHGVPIGKSCSLRESVSLDSGAASCEWAGAGSTPDQSTTGYKIAMSGDTWRVLRSHYPLLTPRVLSRGAVFARMTAYQKQQLVVDFQAMGYYVCMCGDGANDCGALRAAHSGVSLSEAESSVAAPFTSLSPHPRAVPLLLRQGRAALTTSFGVFKFMVAYSLTEFFSVAFLYYFDSNLTDFQFLFIDVALIGNFALFFGKTEAYSGPLVSIPPLTSLLGLVPLLSIIFQMVFTAIAQFVSFYAISQFPWYVRHTYEGEEENECYENYAVFAVSMFQYVILAVVFSHGAPYRKSVITNKHLMASFIVMTGLCVYIAVSPTDWLAHFLQLRMPKDILMCYIVLIIAIVHLLVALFFERFFIQYLLEVKQMIPKFIKERTVRKTPHLLIKRQITEYDYLNYEDVITYEDDSGASGLNGSSKDR